MSLLNPDRGTHPSFGRPTLKELTLVLNSLDRGDASAAAALLPLVYDELRQLAAARLARESAAHTLQPTALVHEVWLRLGADAQPRWESRAHFFGAAAEAMRRILIDAARRRHAQRHGGGLVAVELSGAAAELNAPHRDAELLAVHEAVDRLAEIDARAAEVVKLRYFAGLSFAETAEVLKISPITAKRDWAFARAWLFRAIAHPT